MNGRDEFQTGLGAETPPEPEEGVAAGVGATPAAVQDAPGTGSGAYSSGPAPGAARPKLKSSRPGNMWGYYVPDSVQNALSPLAPLGKQYVAWIGSGLLLIGLFLPAKTYSYSAFNISASTSQSLWDYGTFWGVVLLLLVAASALVAYVRDYKWLVVTGGAALIILIINFLYAFSGVLGFSAHPTWGWIFLFPGVLLILAAGAMRSTARDAENDEGVNSILASIQKGGGTTR